MALDEGSVNVSDASGSAQQTEVKELKKQLASLQRIQKVTFSQLSELREEKDYFMDQEKKRAEHAKTRAKKRLLNGASRNHTNGDVEMNDGTDATSGSESDGADES
jgi:pre-rRNA-processing protein IPI3